MKTRLMAPLSLALLLLSPMVSMPVSAASDTAASAVAPSEATPPPVGSAPPRDENQTYSPEEIVRKASDFFGATTEAVAKAVESVVSKYGRPNAYIAGSEGSAAFVVGLRYGEGDLYMKSSEDKPVKVFWQGPSVGFDFGGNASKTFTLVYNLPDTESIYQRFPGVDGSFYFVAGIGVNYQQNGNVVLAPMRTGLGLRWGVNGGYLSYAKARNWIPF